MPTQGATAVILKPKTNEVLLHKREDFRVWSLPGGQIEPGETWEEAAIRETFEETGYRIGITRLVGKYARPQLPGGGNITYVAAGYLLDAAPEAHGWETVEVRWFPVDALPASLSGFGRTFIADTLAELPEPIERTLLMPWHQALLLRFLFWLRDLRNRAFPRS